jgi:uncharacterized protein YqjF (DUF2071 family)
MTQTWHDLLFAHWSIDTSRLAPLVPAPLELDLFDGKGWIAVVPFHMTNVAPRGVPSLPRLSAFPELNVRTYVRVNGQPGVYFFSLDATSVLAVATARALFHLPYFVADMKVELDHGDVRYDSRRSAARSPRPAFAARYRANGAAFSAAPGSLEYFLTERYGLYTVGRDARPRRVDIHHRPWSLQTAQADITINTMAEAAGLALPRVAPLLHFARRQDVVAWAPQRC